MPEYRRAFVPGGTFFLTIATHGRRPLFRDEANVMRLRSAIAAVQAQWPFAVVAAVVLPDHLHFLWTLPTGDSDFSRRVGRMKALFTKSLPPEDDDKGSSLSRIVHRDAEVWQRRFWEHVIRDERDFANHLDYIHYNPVKHGLAACAHGWRHSSFAAWVRKGPYEAGWCCACQGPSRLPPGLAELDRLAGE